MLTAPIEPFYTDDPAATYSQMVAGLSNGQTYVQPFDYSIKEMPTATTAIALEEKYPNSPLLSADGDLDSWEIEQGGLAICGSIAHLAGYAAIPSDNPYALEKGVYPLERNPYHLYFVRVRDPRNLAKTTWVAIDSLFPCSASYKLLFCRPIDEAGFVAQLLLKAMATVRGGSFDELTNSAQFKRPFLGFFPHKEVITSSFGIVKAAIAQGSVNTITFKDNPFPAPGIVLAHAFAVVDAIEEDGHQLVRVQNPWGAGKDFVSATYSETSTWWANYPHLEPKRLAAATGGNFWVGWDELMLIANPVKTRTVTL